MKNSGGKMAVGESQIRGRGVAPSDCSKTATPVSWGLVEVDERRRLTPLGKHCCGHKADHSVDGCHPNDATCSNGVQAGGLTNRRQNQPCL